jgi:hypothetical protein
MDSLVSSARSWPGSTRAGARSGSSRIRRPSCILADAYDDFEQRVAAAAESTGSKQDRVRDYILGQAPPEFRRRGIERALPGISPATIRLVLNELRDAKQIRPEGSGPGARWHRVDQRLAGFDVISDRLSPGH